jgi:putative redox protein
VAHRLAERGIAVLRFDFTGLGQSDGRFADTTLTSNVDDVLAVVEHLRGLGRAPQLLVGHSLGGAAMMIAAPRVPECVAVATIATPAETGHLSESLLAHAPHLADGGTMSVEVAGKVVEVGASLIADLAEYDLRAVAAEIGKPYLILHSPLDEIADVDHAARLFVAAKHPKSFLSLGTADHLLLKDERDAHLVADVHAAWVDRYLTAASESAGGAGASSNGSPPGGSASGGNTPA